MKKRPINEEFDQFSMCNTCSATECTGLVTRYATEDELENYMQVYSYQAEVQPDNEEENKI